MAYSCPSCQAELKAAHFGPIELDLCIPCGSVWFDRGELPQVAGYGAAPLQRLAEKVGGGGSFSPRTGGRCPACSVPMGLREFPWLPGVQVSACTICQGFWLPAITLRMLAATLAAKASAGVPVGTGGQAGGASAGPVPGADPFKQPLPSRNGAPAPNVYKPEGAAQGPKLTAAPQRRAVSAEPTVGKKRCPKCAQPNDAAATVCWACSEVFPGARLPACPGCGGRLRAVDSDGVPMGACEDCGGVLIGGEELDTLHEQHQYVQEKLVETVEKLYPGRNAVLFPKVICPDCRVPMKEQAVGMISVEPVETCPQCAKTYLEPGMLRVVLTGKRKR